MSELPWKKNLHLCLPTFKCLPLISPTPNPPQSSFNQDHHHSISLTASDDLFSSSSDSLPDFATVFASHRFFFASPGRSNSIVESSYTKPSFENVSLFVTKGMTVAKYSSNPYFDFRKSMEEMLEARKRNGDDDDDDDDHNAVLKSEFDYLHELLLCYIELNPLEAHKDIISAFTDVVICLLSGDDDDQRREDKGS